MTARSEIIEAARDLTDRGLAPFSPADIIQELRRRGSTYPDSTVRTHVVSSMCIQAPQGYYRDLERVGHGLYRLADKAGRGGSTSRARPSQPASPATQETETPTSRPWYWEGRVQAALVTHVAVQGWRILRVADTTSREHGVDVVAERDGERLLAEVKGFPADVYARGGRAGQPKPSGQLPAQARHYFADALLQGLLLAAEEPSNRAAIVLPDLPTYRSLGERVGAPLHRAGVEVWLVTEDGRVQLERSKTGACPADCAN